jgi:predicted NBD/HSP70 family sugar kinase
LPLASRLAESLGRPVLADNEVHLALLAERWQGAIQGIDNAFLVHIGVGIGCGILIDGQLYRGATGAAGEIGYLPIVDDDEIPPGSMGPFELAAGGGVFARLDQLPGRRVLFCERSLPVTLEPSMQRSSLPLLPAEMFLPRRWSTSSLGSWHAVSLQPPCYSIQP